MMSLLKIFAIVLIKVLCCVSLVVKFPTLPDAYSVGFELKSLLQQDLFEGTEYNDITIDQTSFDYRINGRVHRMTIFDYANGVSKTLDLTGGRKKCLWITTISKSQRYKPKHVRESSMLLTSQLMGKNDEKIMYIGETKVRDIMCYHWQRKENSSKGEETIDYYFRNSTANFYVPVRIRENSTMIHHDNIYDYFDFKVGRPSFEVFQAPFGAFCALARNLARPRLPEVISMSYEYEHPARNQSRSHHDRHHSNHTYHSNFSQRSFVINGKMNLDIPSKQFRLDHHKSLDHNHHHWVAVKDIYDYQHGLHYEIVSNLQCKISKIASNNDTSNSSAPDLFNLHRNTWHLFIKLAIEHFNKYTDDYFYEGEAMVRGMRADVWIYKHNTTGRNGSFNEIEWYFLNNNTFEISTNVAKRELSVPVQVVGYYGDMEKETFRINLFDVSQNVYRESSILSPIRHCLELHESVYTLTLFLKGLTNTETTALYNQTDLANVVLDALEKFTAVSRSRMAVQLITSWKQIDVYLSIFDHPFKDSEAIEHYVPAKEVAQKIKEGLFQHDIGVKFKDGNKTYSVTFKKAYFDGIALVFSDLENGNTAQLTYKCADDATEIIILFVFVFVALIGGCAVGVCIVHYRLKKNGYHLKAMLRSKQKLDETHGGVDMPAPVEMHGEN